MVVVARYGKIAQGTDGAQRQVHGRVRRQACRRGPQQARAQQVGVVRVGELRPEDVAGVVVHGHREDAVVGERGGVVGRPGRLSRQAESAYTLTGVSCIQPKSS